MTSEDSIETVILDGARYSAGQTVGPFTLKGRLGKGGMGEVWKAEYAPDGPAASDEATHVAVKFMLYGHGDSDLAQRFLRECTAMERLKGHSGIVQHVDHGSIGRNPYLAMELVIGRDLKDLIEAQAADGQETQIDLGQALTVGGPKQDSHRTLVVNRRYGPDDFVRIGQEVARALQYAHDNGIVHRDVKPANILVATNSGVKVTDFGIAQVLNVQSDLTQTGTIVGSPLYMSPEQADGMETGPHSDIYSLGVTLYHALAGVVPFKGDNRFQVIRAVSEGKAVHLRDYGVPGGLADVVMKMMAKDPDARFRSAGHAAEALERKSVTYSIPELQRLVRESPNNPDFHMQLGIALYEDAITKNNGARRRALGRVLGTLEKATFSEMDQPDKVAEMNLLLAKAYAERNTGSDVDSAYDALTIVKALAITNELPDLAVYFNEEARLDLRQGEPGRALATFSSLASEINEKPRDSRATMAARIDHGLWIEAYQQVAFGGNPEPRSTDGFAGVYGDVARLNSADACLQWARACNDIGIRISNDHSGTGLSRYFDNALRFLGSAQTNDADYGETRLLFAQVATAVAQRMNSGTTLQLEIGTESFDGTAQDLYDAAITAAEDAESNLSSERTYLGSLAKAEALARLAHATNATEEGAEAVTILDELHGQYGQDHDYLYARAVSDVQQNKYEGGLTPDAPMTKLQVLLELDELDPNPQALHMARKVYHDPIFERVSACGISEFKNAVTSYEEI